MKTQTTNTPMKKVMYAMMMVMFLSLQINAKELKSVKVKSISIEDVKPVPVGGVSAIINKISYPKIAEKLGMQGMVKLNAVINESGDVVHVNIIKGLGAGCDEEAVKALKTTKFVPGSSDGKNTKSVYPLTIVFKLDGSGN